MIRQDEMVRAVLMYGSLGGAGCPVCTAAARLLQSLRERSKCLRSVRSRKACVWKITSETSGEIWKKKGMFGAARGGAIRLP